MKESPLVSSTTQPELRVWFSNRTILFFEILLLTLFCISTLILTLNNAGALTFDEFYHFLAAKSWAENGTLAIGDGTYSRGWLFTKAIGVVFILFGQSLDVARFIPVLGGVAWALVVFLWTRFFMSRLIAWIAVMMFMFSSDFYSLSTYLRFYTWHGFLVFLAFTLGTLFLSRSGKWMYSNFLLILLAIVSILLAYHLQDSTLIAIVGFSLFLILFYHDVLVNFLIKIFSNKRYLFLSASLLAAVVYFSYASHLPQYIWINYSHTALWLAHVDVRMYHWHFENNYPLLWSVFPVMAFWAAVNRPPYGLACVVIFSTAFLLHSFAGMRAFRYLAYALPFFFIISSISIVDVIKSLSEALANADNKYLNSYLTLHRLAFPIIVCLIFITFCFSISVNSGFKDAYNVIVGERRNKGIDWSPYTRDLIRVANLVDTVVVTYGVAGFYYIGDINYVMSRTIMLETDTQEEFGYDGRIGRRVISNLSSLKMIMDCYPSGLIVIDKERWGDPLRGTDSETNSFIIENTSPVSLKDNEALHAYVWRNMVRTVKKPECREIQSPVR
jgi:hypothetical protein